MTDKLATSLRSMPAGVLRTEHAGRRLQLAGWVHRHRDLGGVVFLDLRDRAGLLQVSFDPAWTPPAIMEAARGLAAESVVQVEGMLERRYSPNLTLPTGDVELRAENLRVLSVSEPLPIPVYRTPNEELPSEELRLRHRYLDLRRAELQQNFMIRHAAAQAVRGYLDREGFLEVETPMLTKPTPEGARDYLVPSRVHAGEFYALPQSPQLYKQLLMVSGFDRYYQIARCLRDEDLRADRQPEFTQIDVEMSFVDEEDVFRVAEGMIADLWQKVLGVQLDTPFPRLTYAEAMRLYGTDKPDLRFDLPIVDVTEVLQATDFRLFQATAGTTNRIRGIRVPGAARLSRREIDELQEVAKRGGAAGTLWVKRSDEGLSGQFAKALTDPVLSAFYGVTGLQPGDLFVAVAGAFRDAGDGSPLDGALDELRRHLARTMELVDGQKHAWAWVTEFPLFEWDADANRLLAAHHPFTQPHPEDVAALFAATERDAPVDPQLARALDRLPARSRAYDAVYNGHELASGSVRIHDAETQRRIFRALGIGAEEAAVKFGFLLEAFRYGAPPHAGFAFGFDRLVMLLAGATNLRDVIAFPKTTSARALFEGAPSRVDAAEHAALHLAATDA
ncbi:aspartate--tRNA ligase [soil metagenome]